MPGRIAPGDSDVPPSWTTVFSGLSGVLGAGVAVVVAGGAAKTAGAGVAFTSLLVGGFVAGVVFLAWLWLVFGLALGLETDGVVVAV